MTADEIAEITQRIDNASVAEAVDWSSYLTCPTCKARPGAACVALNGRVAGGRPDGVAVPLPHAHVARRRSVRARRACDLSPSCMHDVPDERR